MRHFYPDKRCIRMIQVILSASALGILVIVRNYTRAKKAAVISGVILILLFFCLIFIYLPLYFSSLKYTVTDTEIIRTGGIFIKLRQSVRFSSIQYATVIKTFLSEYTGLNFIIFFVFGGRLRLMFLSCRDTDEILSLTGTAYGKEK